MEGVEDGLGPCESVWEGNSVGISPTGRPKFRRQMAAANKTESVSLSICWR